MMALTLEPRGRESVIERILQAMKIRPGETAKVALMFLYLFVVVSVFI